MTRAIWILRIKLLSYHYGRTLIINTLFSGVVLVTALGYSLLGTSFSAPVAMLVRVAKMTPLVMLLGGVPFSNYAYLIFAKNEEPLYINGGLSFRIIAAFNIAINAVLLLAMIIIIRIYEN